MLRRILNRKKIVESDEEDGVEEEGERHGDGTGSQEEASEEKDVGNAEEEAENVSMTLATQEMDGVLKHSEGLEETGMTMATQQLDVLNDDLEMRQAATSLWGTQSSV